VLQIHFTLSMCCILSAQFYSTLLYSILFYCTVPIIFHFTLFYSILLSSIPFYSLLFHFTLFYSILLSSIPFYSLLFHFTLFYSILLSSIPFYSLLFHFTLFYSILFCSMLWTTPLDPHSYPRPHSKHHILSLDTLLSSHSSSSFFPLTCFMFRSRP
jgi:hypothetical protein